MATSHDDKNKSIELVAYSLLFFPFFPSKFFNENNLTTFERQYRMNDRERKTQETSVFLYQLKRMVIIFVRIIHRHMQTDYLLKVFQSKINFLSNMCFKEFSV